MPEINPVIKSNRIMDEKSHAEWRKRRKERLERNNARKQQRFTNFNTLQEDKRFDDIIQSEKKRARLEARRLLALSSSLPHIKKIKVSDLPSIPEKKSSPLPPSSPAPTFNKILYIFLSLLFFIPGYLYKKHYDAQYQQFLTQTQENNRTSFSSDLESPPTPSEQDLLAKYEEKYALSKPGPFSPEELERMHKTADIDVSVKKMAQIVSVPLSVPKSKPSTPPRSKPFFSCFDCFFKPQQSEKSLDGQSIPLEGVNNRTAKKR